MRASTILIVAAVAIFLTTVLGFAVIPALRRLKYGQTILDIGPKWHEKTKQGTPTMGGVMFIIGITAAVVLGYFFLFSEGVISLADGGLVAVRGLSGLLLALCFGFIGFLDDYLKVRKKKNEGLTSTQKFILQCLVVAAYFTARVLSGNTATVIRFPFLGQLDLWYFYYVVMGLGMVYIVNAVNLTDGIDGLCSSVSFIYFIAFALITSILGNSGLCVLSVAAAGGCLGFLFWNFHPAKVFMGDTGSLFLGGIVVSLGVGSGAEVLMVIAAGVFIWEALTVLIQTTYFKITHGKRLFKMTPIHHSFELRGWSEVKIVTVFSLITLVCAAVAVALTYGL